MVEHIDNAYPLTRNSCLMKKNFNSWHGAQAAWRHGRYGNRYVCAKQVA